VPRLPLIEDLTKGAIPPGSVLLVEFDAASAWLTASLTIAAGWLKEGGAVAYNGWTQSPDDLRAKLSRLGLQADALEKEGRLLIWDAHTATLGQKSKERMAPDSLKVADLSLFVKGEMGPPEPSWLHISDNASTLARFNDDKSWTELLLTRFYPFIKLGKMRSLSAFTRGLHGEWVYRKLEAEADGVIDFRLDESADPPRNLIRIRSLRDVGFDGRWRSLKISENFEVAVEK
jgi:KaiC/GvpD/RAD55 family RecA-like ATPase